MAFLLYLHLHELVSFLYIYVYFICFKFSRIQVTSTDHKFNLYVLRIKSTIISHRGAFRSHAFKPNTHTQIQVYRDFLKHFYETLTQTHFNFLVYTFLVLLTTIKALLQITSTTFYTISIPHTLTIYIRIHNMKHRYLNIFVSFI